MKAEKNGHRGALRMAWLWLACASAFTAVHAEQPACDNGQRDWEQESFGITLPAPPPVDMARLPVPLIERHYHGPYRMASQLVRGDFAGLQAHWDGIARMTDRTEQMRAVVRSLDVLRGRGLSSLHQAQAWHANHPHSPAAQLVLAAVWVHAAYEVHHDRYVPERGGGYHHRPRSRAQQALPLLDGLMAQGGFYGMAAREVDLPARYLLGGEGVEAAWDRYMALIEHAPQHEGLYLRAAVHAGSNPDDRDQRFAQIRAMADRHGLAQPHRRALDQELDAYIRPSGRDPNPRTWRPYWEARVKIAPTIHNLAGWLEAESRVDNWAGMMAIADRILALDPHHQRALEHRARALRQVGRSREAYEASFAAMLVGSDWGMDQIVQGYVRGGLGLPHQDFDALYAHCKLGASLGLASAANCMGSAHSEGFAGVQRDDAQALAWHLLGARGGHASSAHDAAVLLPRVVRDPALRADIDVASAHWVKKAASHDHAAAQDKLAARPDWGLLCLPGGGPSLLQRLYKRLRGGQ